MGPYNRCSCQPISFCLKKVVSIFAYSGSMFSSESVNYSFTA
jgi:hypothetical protein